MSLSITEYLIEKRKGRSHGKALLNACSLDITGTGTISSKVKNIKAAVTQVVNADPLAGSASAQFSNVTGITDEDINIEVVSLATTPAIAQESGAKTVHAIVVGDTF